MEKIKSLQKSKRTQKDYSLAFKLQVVDEVEKGYLTYKQAQRKYGIQGRSTVLVWLRKHGRLNWDYGGKMDHKKTPYYKIKELENRVRELEQETQVLNTAIDIADEILNINIRKKFCAGPYKNTNQGKDTE